MIAAFYLLQMRCYVRVLAGVRILPAPLALMLLRRIPRASTVLRLQRVEGVSPYVASVG